MNNMNISFRPISHFLLAAALLSVASLSQAQTAPTGATQRGDDFGMNYSLAIEKQLAPGLDLQAEGNYRSQDNLRRTDRWTVGADLSYRIFRTRDKKFNIKLFAGFEYTWKQKLGETDARYNKAGALTGYNVKGSYWRHRSRLNAGVSATFKPSKRWAFQLKETYQHSHYKAENGLYRERWRMNDDDELYLRDTDPRSVSAKSLDVLRSKFTVSYNVKGLPLEPFVSADFAQGLDSEADDAQKWRFTGGTDYTVAKRHKFSLWYRYTTSDDDEDAAGHLIGLGYKFSF